MSVLTKAAAVLAAAHPDELRYLSPAERRRLADMFWRWSIIADPDKPKPRSSGVLASLHDGERAP